MDTSPFELTSQQKALLQTLSQETGEEIPVLIHRALSRLQEETSSGGMGETDYLLSSSKNADRLLEAVRIP